jgi:multidrug efflux pump subunit AcrA (membrane-fusion protein)
MSGFFRENSAPVLFSVLLHGAFAAALVYLAVMSTHSPPTSIQSVPINAVVVDSQILHAAQRAQMERTAQEAAQAHAAAEAQAAAKAAAEAKRVEEDQAAAKAPSAGRGRGEAGGRGESGRGCEAGRRRETRGRRARAPGAHR